MLIYIYREFLVTYRCKTIRLEFHIWNDFVSSVFCVPIPAWQEKGKKTEGQEEMTSLDEKKHDTDTFKGTETDTGTGTGKHAHTHMPALIQAPAVSVHLAIEPRE